MSGRGTEQTAGLLRSLEKAWVAQERVVQDLMAESTSCFRILGESDCGLDLDAFGVEKGWCLFAYLKDKSQQEIDWRGIAKAWESHWGAPVMMIGGALKEGASSVALPALYHAPHQDGGALNPSGIFWTKEGGLSFRLEMEGVLNPGLFMDQRDNRRLLRQRIKENLGSVLNLFSYTGAFSLAAAAGGAQATSIDVSKRYLSWEKENHERNGTLSLSRRVAEDSRKFLGRASRRILAGDAKPYSWIVLDPPTFSRSAGVLFRVEKDLPSMVEACAGVLTPAGGGILISTNDGGWSKLDFERSMRSLAKSLKFTFAQGSIAPDFRREGYPLKSAWLLRNF